MPEKYYTCERVKEDDSPSVGLSTHRRGTTTKTRPEEVEAPRGASHGRDGRLWQTSTEIPAPTPRQPTRPYPSMSCPSWSAPLTTTRCHWRRSSAPCAPGSPAWSACCSRSSPRRTSVEERAAE